MGPVGGATHFRASRLLRNRWVALALLVLAGVVVYLPALRSPYLLDDYLHASMVDGTFPASRNPFDLYNFVSDADRALLLERGLFPWWSDPGITIRFCRPLSSVLGWLDHKILGHGAALLHVHSLLWWLAAVLGARALFRRVLAARAGFFATVIYALAPCHALPLAWLANRDVLVSLAFGIPALGLYLRFREQRALRDGVLSALLFGASMLGGEYAMSFGGYVLAFELIPGGPDAAERSRAGRLARRAVGLSPFVVPALAYLHARSALGFGSRGSGFYTDPFQEPLSFLLSAPRRAGTLLAKGWLSLDTESLGNSTPAWVPALLVIGCTALFYAPVRRALARLDAVRRRSALLLLLGSVFALAPVLAVMPSPRLLGASMLGIAPIVALVFEEAWFPATIAARRGVAELTELVALGLGFAHLVHGPATSWLTGRHFQRSAVSFAEHAKALEGRLGLVADAQVYVLRGLGGSFFLPFALDAHGRLPARWRILAQTGHVLALRRDARTLELVVPRGNGMFPPGTGNLFRTEHAKMKVGEVYEVPGLRATVLELGPEGPRRVRFEADRDLDSPELVWITEGIKGFQVHKLPPPGFGQPFDP